MVLTIEQERSASTYRDRVLRVSTSWLHELLSKTAVAPSGPDLSTKVIGHLPVIDSMPNNTITSHQPLPTCLPLHLTHMQVLRRVLGCSSILTFGALGTSRKRASRQGYLHLLAQVSERHRHPAFDSLKRFRSGSHSRQICLVELHLELSCRAHQGRL